MNQRRLTRVLAATALGAVGAGLAVPGTALAAPPTRISDRTYEIYCSATGANGEEVNFYAATSELAGTVGAVQASTADGTNLGGGEGVSDWSASSFRAAVDVYDLDDVNIGTAYVAGGFEVVGEPERFTSKFRDGNVRVVEDHSFTGLAVHDVTATFPGIEIVDLSCDGAAMTGSLFFTNPTAHVGTDGGLVAEDCRLVNAEGFFFEGTIDELGVGLTYADDPNFSAFSPAMDLSGGEWTGQWNAADDEGPMPVNARVTLERTGDPVRLGDSGRWGSERFVLTPYELDVRVDGPVAGARVTCQLIDVDYRFRTMTK